MEHDDEPIRGLPGPLPPGERILWQGAPNWRVLTRSAFPARLVGLYFLVLAGVGLAGGSLIGAALTLAAGLVCIGLFALIAWASARTSIYTLTDKRIVLRVGVALPKCVNLPLRLVVAGDLRPLGAGYGDIALTMVGERHRIFLLLWPHVRAWKRRPQPLLRAVRDAEDVAARLARAVAALTPVDRAEPAAARPVGTVEPLGAAA